MSAMHRIVWIIVRKMAKSNSGIRYVIFAGSSLIVLLVILISWNYLPSNSSDSRNDGDTPFDEDEDLVSKISAANLLEHVQDLYRIKQSVLKQLRDLEKKVAIVSVELVENDRRVKELKEEIVTLNETCVMLQRAAYYLELESGHSPKIGKPLRIFPDPVDRNFPEISTGQMDFRHCTMDSCFDYSRCPITSGFPVFLDKILSADCQNSGIFRGINESPYIVQDPDKACLFVVIICVESQIADFHQSSYARSHGLNVLIFMEENIDRTRFDGGKAIVADVIPSRRAFDLLIPETSASVENYRILPHQVPARRKKFLVFSGFWNSSTRLSDEYGPLIDALTEFKNSSRFETDFSCYHEPETSCPADVWCYCDHEESLASRLGNSTFSLVIPDNGAKRTAISRIIDGIKYGALPVILGSLDMPFEETIDWFKAAVRLPLARAPELQWILSSIRDEDILAYRRNGRLIWESYFATAEKIASTALEVIRQRLNLPAAPFVDYPLANPFNQTFKPVWFAATTLSKKEDAEVLGPIEFPYPSDTFQRNFSTTNLDRYETWNLWFNPGVLAPSSPFAPVLHGDAKFRGSEYGFRPLGGGLGGTGAEFREALSGNYPREQFTVVILTYQRESVLSVTLANLNNLPYLHKVIIIWNSEFDSLEPLALPKLHVDIHIHKSAKNSLNNRFLPLDAIETECVLHLDDDVRLRHDEIVLAFRVWRENRERIVGFPARYHAWDVERKSWNYNSNYSCEYSMILTGAALLHKYYMYMYSSTMPEVIRQKVDEYRNCEDIAMNFLVAHHVRKPPIKVTSRWTFPCPDCALNLWEDSSHFQERSQCIQFFEKIYGYMPLLSSQFRADSVLFKTRIPSDKQKCFRYV